MRDIVSKARRQLVSSSHALVQVLIPFKEYSEPTTHKDQM